jgi:hypothetical protein
MTCMALADPLDPARDRCVVGLPNYPFSGRQFGKPNGYECLTVSLSAPTGPASWIRFNPIGIIDSRLGVFGPAFAFGQKGRTK